MSGRTRGRARVLVGCAAAAGAAAALAAGTPVGFATPIELGDSDRSANVVVADVTGDGLPDVVLLAAGAPHLTVHPGRADGGFDTVFHVPTAFEIPTTTGGMRFVRAARLNADAAFDLVVDHGTAPGFDVLLSDGRGGFARTTTAADDVGGEIPCVADWDGDGKLDIVSVSVGAAAAALYVRLGDGAGGFAAPQTIALDGSTGSITDVVAADLDGDGDADVAVLDSQALRVFWRQADGSPSAAVTLKTLYAQAPFEHGLAAADVDGDGLPDLVAQTFSTDMVYEAGSAPAVWIARHAGPAAFAEVEIHPFVQSWTGATPPKRGVLGLDVADVNGDGRPDVVTPRALFVNRGGGAFAPALRFAVGEGSGAAAGDVTGDGRADVVLAGAAIGGTVLPTTTSLTPFLSSVSRTTFYAGGFIEFEARGGGFQPGAELRVGDAVSTGDRTATWSPNVVHGWIAVPADAPLGPTTLTLVDPDGGEASLPATIAAPRAATLLSLEPTQIHAGDATDVLVRGDGFLEYVFGRVSGPSDAQVASTNVVSETEAHLIVSLSESAEQSVRDVILGNGSAVFTTLPQSLGVLPRRPLALSRGRVGRDSERRGRQVSASGALPTDLHFAGGRFDPQADEASVAFGNELVSIPPRAGWRVRGKRAVWTSARGDSPRARLVLDFAKGKFEFAARVFDAGSSSPVVRLVLAGQAATSAEAWKPVRGGALSFVKR